MLKAKCTGLSSRPCRGLQRLSSQELASSIRQQTSSRGPLLLQREQDACFRGVAEQRQLSCAAASTSAPPVRHSSQLWPSFKLSFYLWLATRCPSASLPELKRLIKDYRTKFSFHAALTVCSLAGDSRISYARQTEQKRAQSPDCWSRHWWPGAGTGIAQERLRRSNIRTGLDSHQRGRKIQRSHSGIPWDCLSTQTM